MTIVDSEIVEGLQCLDEGGLPLLFVRGIGDTACEVLCKYEFLMRLQKILRHRLEVEPVVPFQTGRP